MTSRRFQFYFAGREDVQLIETRFITSPSGGARVSVRGKTSGALRHAGTFQWTSGVRALCVLFLKGALYKAGGCSDALLIGGCGTLAASLDYATSKQPTWLVDMFGADTMGRCEFGRLINRTNTERKRPGPTVISLKAGVIDDTTIEVFIDGGLVSSVSGLVAILAKLIDAQDSTKRSEVGAEQFTRLVA